MSRRIVGFARVLGVEHRQIDAVEARSDDGPF
jgi:hypothetical protein